MLIHFGEREEVVDELESHLRDVIDELVLAGVPSEQAVETAIDRLGRPNDVANEFAKVPPIALPWFPIRLASGVGFLLLTSTLLPLVPKFRAGGISALLATHMSSITLGYAASLIGGVLAVSYLVTRMFHDLRAGQRESLKRAVLFWSGASVLLTGAGVLLGAWCPHEKTGWCLGLTSHEVGGIAILAWGVVMLAGYWRYRNSRNPHRAMLFGVVGNVVVVLGWFGVAPGGSHSVGFLTSVPAVAVLVVSQVAVSFAAFVPAGCLGACRSSRHTF